VAGQPETDRNRGVFCLNYPAKGEKRGGGGAYKKTQRTQNSGKNKEKSDQLWKKIVLGVRRFEQFFTTMRFALKKKKIPGDYEGNRRYTNTRVNESVWGWGGDHGAVGTGRRNEVDNVAGTWVWG